MSHKIENFYKRWNIEYDEDKRFIDFKNRALSTIDEILGEYFLSDINLERIFLKLIAKHFPQSKIGGFQNISKVLEVTSVKEFRNSPVYKIISEENNFTEFIKCLQALFWLDLSSEVKKELYFGFKEDCVFRSIRTAIPKASGH